MTFTLPSPRWGDTWITVLDTRDWTIEGEEAPVKAGEDVDVEARSVVVCVRGS